MTIRAVIFDMGGTIETFWHTPELRLHATPALHTLLQEKGVDPGLDDRQLYEQVNTGWERYHRQGIRTMVELPVEIVWKDFILAGCQVDQEKLADAAEELMTQLEWLYYSRTLRPEMPSVLKQLHAMGLKIGLISNVCSRTQVPHSLDKYGIRQYFDPIVLSSVYGRRKPDPAIFHYAARLINEPTSACLYVGDRIARDIIGARRAGYGYAVQIINDFEHGEHDEGATPDAVIHCMDELLDFINREAIDNVPVKEPGKKIKALLFDAGDILYFRPTRGNHLRAFLQDHQVADQEISPEKANELKVKAYHGLISQDEFREAYLRLYGITDPAILEKGKQALDREDNDIQVIDGVPETMRKLKDEGYLLAIVTDTAVPLYTKLAWFEQAGFGHVWDSIISSREIGIQKPDPLIFNAALEQLGVSACQAAFIGHSVEELEGARALGMYTIAFNGDISTPVDYHLAHFKDLLKVPLLSLHENEKVDMVA